MSLNTDISVVGLAVVQAIAPGRYGKLLALAWATRPVWQVSSPVAGKARIQSEDFLPVFARRKNSLPSMLEVVLGDVGSVELGDPDQRGHEHTAGQQGVVKSTLWYRAPELLLGDSRWTFAIDAWSLGCLGVELVQGMPIFPAKDKVDLLHRIITVFGTPMEA